MRHPVPAVAAAVTLSLGLGACGGDDEKDGKAAAKPAGTQMQEAPGKGCRSARAPEPKQPEGLEAPSQPLDRDKSHAIRFTTSCGVFVVELAHRRSPKTAASVASLVRKGFYDGTTFHRISKGFVIQGGDPSGDGTGGPGYQVTERPPSDTAYTRGVVAMAKGETEPSGRSGSQFFVVTGEQATLPPDYAVLGRIMSGQRTVTLIESVDTGGEPDGPPTAPVLIEKAELLERSQ